MEPGKTEQAKVEHATVKEVGHGRYQLGRVIARESTGTVHEALDSKANLAVTVKVLHPTFTRDATKIARFTREAQLLERIQHPNVARILDLGEDEGGVLYLAMESLQGRRLHDMLQAGPLPREYGLSIVRQVVEGVGAAHEQGVLHRGLTPDSVMVDTDPRDGSARVKLTDFGIAKLAEPGVAGGTVELITGKPEYMSPEQCQGKSADQRADLYACGCILYLTLTGRLPITGRNPVDVILAQCDKVPAPPTRIRPELPEVIDRICVKALAKRPEDRYQSAGELASDIRQAERGSSVSPVPSVDTRRVVAAGGGLRAQDPKWLLVSFALGVAAAALALRFVLDWGP